jgi:ankyrin repeat protein
MNQPPDDQQPFLGKAAYGSYPYKCSVLSCQRFYQGFSSRQERDVHRRSHDRHFKCIFESCKFKTIGFPTKAALNAHVTFFHVASLTHQFSNLKTRSIWQTLVDAIDSNESSLIEDLCCQGKNSLDRPSGIIMRAIKKSNAQTVKTLLAHLGGAEKMEKRVVLACAATRGDAEVLQVIMESIGLANIDMNLSMPLLRSAAQNGHTDAVRVIFALNHTYSSISVSPCWSPLHAAAAGGHNEIVSLILQQPVAYYTAGCFDAAVRAAAANGAESTVKLLLEAGSHNNGWMAKSKFLKKASQKGPGGSVPYISGEYLVPLVNSKGKAFRNGLQNAALANDVDKIKRYLQQGADIDQIAGENGTAIQAAARKGNVSAARFILDQGAKAAIEGGKHGNALAAAAANNHPELVHMLLAAGCNPSIKSRHLSHWRGYGPWNRSKTYQDLTPLHWAAHGKHTEIVQILLGAKADIQTTTSNGYTPLHSAVFPSERSKWKAMQERLPVVRLLLEYGADVKTRDANGDTPLHLIRYRTEYHIPVDLEEALGVAKILIQYGADLDEPNEEGVTPRQTALDVEGDVKPRILEVFTFYNQVAKAVNGLHLTPSAEAQSSESDSGTEAAEAQLFDQNLMLTISTSPDAGPSSPKWESTIPSSGTYSTGQSSLTFTSTPPASERLGNPEMENSLFNNPWADENQQLEATVQQPASVWNLQNCHFCGKEDQETFRFCSGCDGFLS